MQESGKLFFEIPNDAEAKAKLVEAVPSRWAWGDGFLRVPQSLFDSGAVTKSGLEVYRDHPLRLADGWKRNLESGKDERVAPDLYEIIAERKVPSFVKFETAGYGTRSHFAVIQRIVASLLRQGYRGRMCFFSGDWHNEYYSNPATCDMHFESWSGAPVMREEAGSQPARLKLEWQGRYGGKHQHVEPIETACRQLGLREYVLPLSTAA